MLKFIVIKVCFLFFCQNIFAQNSNDLLNKINSYFNSLDEFSATFVQQNENSLQEGMIYKNKKRIRVDYITPSRITIILDKNKAMFFNHDLGEVEYFNPKKTIAKIVFDIFNNNFTEKFTNYKKEGALSKFYFSLEEEILYKIEVVFETLPLQLRLVKIDTTEEILSFGLRDHNFNDTFDKNFFSMANPL